MQRVIIGRRMDEGVSQMSRLLCLILLLSSFALNGLSQGTTGKPAGDKPSENQTQEKQVDLPDAYVIGAEDEFSILVWHEPELSTKVAVRPDGKISFPMLDDITASGLKPKELQEQI